MPADVDLKNFSADIDFGSLKTEFQRMKDVSDQLKGVKDAKELPESLETVDFNEIKTEFEGMK
jgi:hypothetical protein